MDLLGASINAAVVAVVGALLAWLGKGRFDALESRFDDRMGVMESRFDDRMGAMESRFDDRMGAMESRFDRRVDTLEGRFDGLQGSIDGMRSDLTQVALAVGVRPRAPTD